MLSKKVVIVDARSCSPGRPEQRFFGSRSQFCPTSPLEKLLQGLAMAVFLIPTLICPAAFIVGAVDLVTMFMRSRRRSTPGSPTAA
jgi:hypothetical protein